MKKFTLSMIILASSGMTAQQQSSLYDDLIAKGRDYLQQAGGEYIRQSLPESLGGLTDLLKTKSNPIGQVGQDRIVLNNVLKMLAENGNFEAVKFIIDNAQAHKVSLDINSLEAAIKKQISKWQYELDNARNVGRSDDARYIQAKVDAYNKIGNLIKQSASGHSGAGLLAELWKQINTSSAA